MKFKRNLDIYQIRGNKCHIGSRWVFLGLQGLDNYFVNFGSWNSAPVRSSSLSEIWTGFDEIESANTSGKLPLAVGLLLNHPSLSLSLSFAVNSKSRTHRFSVGHCQCYGNGHKKSIRNCYIVIFICSFPHLDMKFQLISSQAFCEHGSSRIGRSNEFSLN